MGRGAPSRDAGRPMTGCTGHEPADGELVACKVSCFLCRFEHVAALPAEAPIRETLAGLTCPKCARKGGVRLALPLRTTPSSSAPASARRPRPEFPPPIPIGIHDEPPDDLGDEDLVARRPWRTPR